MIDKNENPKRGRPTEPDSKNAIVKLRVELAEKGRWVRAARKAGKSLSEWLRELANSRI